MKNFKSLLLLGICLVLFSCHSKKEKLPSVSLRQEWFPNANYAGALFAKNEFAAENGINLIIESGSDQIDPVRLVIEGHNTFGDASADKVLEANDKGADLVVIGVVSYISPTCFIAKTNKNINNPKDFEGKTVGVLTGTNTEYIYRTLVKKNGLDTKKIKEVEAPFDLKSFITSNAYDVRPAYIYDEPVQLDLLGIKYSIIEPKATGVNFLGTVYFTKRSTMEQNPKLVQAFINSIADGWTAALKYPRRAMDFLKTYDNSRDTTKDRDMKSFIKGFDYYKGKDGKILWADQSDWEEMIQSMKGLGLIKKDDLYKGGDYDE